MAELFLGCMNDTDRGRVQNNRMKENIKTYVNVYSRQYAMEAAVTLSAAEIPSKNTYFSAYYSQKKY